MASQRDKPSSGLSSIGKVPCPNFLFKLFFCSRQRPALVGEWQPEGNHLACWDPDTLEGASTGQTSKSAAEAGWPSLAARDSFLSECTWGNETRSRSKASRFHRHRLSSRQAALSPSGEAPRQGQQRGHIICGTEVPAGCSRREMEDVSKHGVTILPGSTEYRILASIALLRSTDTQSLFPTYGT